MARHSAKSQHTLRVRTAIGGALTAGALLTAPIAVTAIAGVAQAQPGPTPSDQVNQLRDALKGASDAHKERVAIARGIVKNGIETRNPQRVAAGFARVGASKQQLRVEVQGILRGTLGGGDPE